MELLALPPLHHSSITATGDQMTRRIAGNNAINSRGRNALGSIAQKQLPIIEVQEAGDRDWFQHSTSSGYFRLSAVVLVSAYDKSVNTDCRA
jgi:hypothetical protein